MLWQQYISLCFLNNAESQANLEEFYEDEKVRVVEVYDMMYWDACRDCLDHFVSRDTVLVPCAQLNFVLHDSVVGYQPAIMRDCTAHLHGLRP